MTLTLPRCTGQILDGTFFHEHMEVMDPWGGIHSALDRGYAMLMCITSGIDIDPTVKTVSARILCVNALFAIIKFWGEGKHFEIIAISCFCLNFTVGCYLNKSLRWALYIQ